MDKVKFQKELIEYIDISLEKISKTFAREFKLKYGLTPNQMSSLWYLRKFGRMTMGTFASKLHMSKQQATKHIQELVERNLVKREYENNNRRIIYICLTDEGLILTQKAEEKYTERFLSEMEKLADNEQERLLKAMKDLAEILPKMTLRDE